MYSCIRKLLFALPAEFSHQVTLKLLGLIYPAWRVKKIIATLPQKPVSLWGLTFPNPVGLAAGLDKNGECLDALFGMGFGFIEVGAVTPRPQSGNPKPRLFRLLRSNALINRMGFNNRGVDYLVEKLKRRKIPGIVGVNIGKNRDTSLRDAYKDYERCLERVYPYADYVSVNLSSPNTPGLRELQGEAYLLDLLSRLITLRAKLEAKYNKKLPLLVKVSPDLSAQEVKNMSTVFLQTAIDGIIATNTTQDRAAVVGEQKKGEQGGLSGKPLFDKMLRIIEQFSLHTQGKIPLIAVGGIDSSHKARQALTAGATLIQLYTGLIYQGPSLIKTIITHL